LFLKKQNPFLLKDICKHYATEKIQISARISKELYDRCIQKYDNITNAINTGLKLSLEECRINEIQNENKCMTDEISMYESIKELQEKIRIKEIEISTKEKLTETNQEMKELHQEMVNNLKENINSLNEQIKKKDNQIEDLNKTLFTQASDIYNLTVNTKLLPESKIKRWWEFWKN
jgi:chromosome segregation ATPase